MTSVAGCARPQQQEFNRQVCCVVPDAKQLSGALSLALTLALVFL